MENTSLFDDAPVPHAGPGASDSPANGDSGPVSAAEPRARTEPDGLDIRQDLRAFAPASAEEDGPDFAQDHGSPFSLDLGASVAAGEKDGEVTDPIEGLVSDFERQLRAHVAEGLHQRIQELDRRYQIRAASLEQTAETLLRKRDAELRAHYRAHYLQKAQILRDHHQSLVAFAGKVKAQRAQLKSVRLQMEEKLKAANLLYEQVEEMRRVLAETPGAATQPDMRGR